MIFWDSSAILPLCIDETMTSTVKEVVKRDPAMMVWWGLGSNVHQQFLEDFETGH
jgi:hypothetical protein